MRKINSLIFFLAPLLWLLHPPHSAAQAIVADPLLDYYQANDATIEEPIQVISCHFTGDHRESFLITDASQGGYRHFSGSDWTFYYPIKGGKYRRTLNGYSGDVPAYIGYVKKLGETWGQARMALS